MDQRSSRRILAAEALRHRRLAELMEEELLARDHLLVAEVLEAAMEKEDSSHACDCDDEQQGRGREDRHRHQFSGHPGPQL